MNALASLALAGVAAALLAAPHSDDKNVKKDDPLMLGNFSVSLTVKDIKASKAFYEKLGFQQVAGVLEQKWVVLQSGTTNIGLFQGMFEKNSLTFNPGWDHEKKTPKDFQDVRELQKLFKSRGIELDNEADEASDGPASFSLTDPDGNPILFDQFVPKPRR